MNDDQPRCLRLGAAGRSGRRGGKIYSTLTTQNGFYAIWGKEVLGPYDSPEEADQAAARSWGIAAAPNPGVNR